MILLLFSLLEMMVSYLVVQCEALPVKTTTSDPVGMIPAPACQ